MPDLDSSAPYGTPRIPARIVDGLKAAIAEPDSRPGAFIELVVSGGVRGEAYEFTYRVDASGRASTRMRDELRERHLAEREVEPDRDRFRSIARAIDIEALLRAESPSAGFSPDSVVGRLVVSDGEQTVRFTFLADPDQAERQDARAPEPLRRAVEAVYGSAAQVLGDDRLHP